MTLPPRTREVLGVLALLLAAGALRWLPAVTGVAAFTAEDFPVLNLPVREYLGAHLRAGLLVMWTPLLQTGFPLFAESQMGATYPLRALHALPVPAWTVLAWTIVLHLAWAGTGLYACLRAVGVRRAAALIPAAALAFSPLLVVRHQHTNVLEALSWWPWLLLAVELGVRERRWVPWLGAGVAAGLMAMAGHVQYVLYGWTLAAAYGLVRGGWQPRALVAVAVAGGLAAAQYLPLAELAGHSIRAHGLGAWELADQVLKPQHLPLFVAPGFWGAIFAPDFGRPALAWEFIAYVGLLPLALAAVGARVRSPVARFWAVVGVIGLLAALGDRFVVHRLLSLLPGWGDMRVPARLLSYTGLAVTVLAGLGAERVLAGEWRPSRRAIGVGVAAVAGAAVAAAVLPPLVGRVEPGAAESSRLALALLAVLAALSLALLARAPGRPALARWGVVLVLADVLATGAAFTPLASPPPYRLPALDACRVAVPPGRGGSVAQWYRPDTNLLTWAPNVFNMSPLTLAGHVELLDRAAEAGGPEARQAVLSLLGVGASFDETSGRLMPVPRPMPRAWTVAEARSGPPPVGEAGWLPAQVAYTGATKPDQPPRPAPGRLVAWRERANRSAAEVEARGDAIWVLNETWYPGRRAFVDGRPAALWRVNAVQSGVVTRGAGPHRVVVVFDSVSVRLGRFIMLLTLAALAASLSARRKEAGSYG